MEQEIKTIRIKLDGLTQLVKTFERTRETSLTITNLELSKMWLGKVLKELGTANPYPESKNPDNEKIEPTADSMPIAESINDSPELSKVFEFTYIQKVKWLRAEIEKVENESKQLYNKRFDSEDISTAWLFPSFVKSIEYCVEAGMWLGMELGRIRDLETK